MNEPFRTLPRPSDYRTQAPRRSPGVMSNFSTFRQTLNGRANVQMAEKIGPNPFKMTNLDEMIQQSRKPEPKIMKNAAMLTSALEEQPRITAKTSTNYDLGPKEVPEISNKQQNLYNMTSKTIEKREASKEAPPVQTMVQNQTTPSQMPAGGAAGRSSGGGRGLRHPTIDDAMLSAAMLPLWRQKFNG